MNDNAAKVNVRKADDRGRTNFGWLDSWHTFSFGEYRDPRHMGYRSLRVINDDIVHGGGGFPTHPHRDMEIITYIVSGALEHKDSLGTGSVIRPGDVQRMTAGTGVTHSEFNHSDKEPVRLLQIWILPARRGLEPGYEQTRFSESERKNRLRIVASPDGRDGSITIHQDALIFASLLEARASVRHELKPGRGAWVQVARGRISVNGVTLGDGDGASIEGAPGFEINAGEPSEILLFDLA